MTIKKIYSKNAIYQKFEVLKINRNKRYKYFEFFVEGVRNINEAIRNNWHICSFIYSNETLLSRWAQNIITSVETEVNYLLPNSLMADLSKKEDTSELLAIVKMRQDNFSQLVLSEKPIIALFDRPSNHGNLGTVIRSCDALGIEGLIITGHAVDLYDPDVISASMGSFFKVPVIRVQNNEMIFSFIQEMKRRYFQFQTVGTTAHKKKSIFEINFCIPTMVMIGNETDGLCKAFVENCDVLGTIPMSDYSSASSLNVGCATTAIFYEAVRQRLLLP